MSDIDKLRDQTIETLIDQAKIISTLLADFKVRAFRDIEAFVETSVEQYGVKSRSVKGNLTLTSFSGRYMIRLQIQDRLVFDERLHAAKTLIDECITSWSENSRDEIKVLVNDAFRVDKTGQINTARCWACAGTPSGRTLAARHGRDQRQRERGQQQAYVRYERREARTNTRRSAWTSRRFNHDDGQKSAFDRAVRGLRMYRQRGLLRHQG